MLHVRVLSRKIDAKEQDWFRRNQFGQYVIGSKELSRAIADAETCAARWSRFDADREFKVEVSEHAW